MPEKEMGFPHFENGVIIKDTWPDVFDTSEQARACLDQAKKTVPNENWKIEGVIRLPQQRKAG